MPKPMFVWSGTAWVSVASEVESLAGFATQSYADNTPGMKLVVPSSVSVGSGTGSVSTQGTVSFSGASSVSLNGCFTSTYDNYRIILNFLGSTTVDLSMRFRTSGTDYSGAQYNISRNVVDATPSSSVSKATGQTSTGLIGVGQTGVKNYNIIEIQNPIIATPTTGYFQTPYSLNSTNLRYDNGYFGVNVNDLFDGCTFICNTGTITGTIRVYGYKAG